VKDADIYVANLGDCRAVMCCDGVATAVTSDHTAAREDERSRIENSVRKCARIVFIMHARNVTPIIEERQLIDRQNSCRVAT
jgi:serine/threonine protein phosphatase PrpC